MMTSFSTRLWDKIAERGPDDCWLWTGSKDGRGYGRIAVASGKPRLAHRKVYEDAVGHIPADMCVCHKCDNPSCCNPRHLFLGTVADNMADMHAKGRARGNSSRAPKPWKAKLTQDQAIAIRKINAPCAVIARLYGVHRNTISLIRNWRTWAGAPERAR